MEGCAAEVIKMESVEVDPAIALEKVNKLTEATGVSFEDARNALRACNWDMIDAMCYLEKLGKVTAYGEHKIFTQEELSQMKKDMTQLEYEEPAAKKKSAAFFSKKLVIAKEGKSYASFPLLLGVIACFATSGGAAVLAFISMMLGYEYKIENY